MSMHGRFSRWMSPVQKPAKGLSGVQIFAGWSLVAGMAAALLFALVTHPFVSLSIVTAFVGISAILELQRAQHVATIASARRGEDVGSFARAFDRRSGAPLDPWAIRAVWNALVPLTAAKGRTIPLRPSDHLVEALEIDSEDLDYLVDELVEQCERQPGNWHANPFYGQLATVGALVHFISAQPLRDAAAVSPAP